jgi:hypothetical protein
MLRPLCFLFVTHNEQCWLVGHHLLLRDFVPHVIIFMNVFSYNRCHGNAVN